MYSNKIEGQLIDLKNSNKFDLVRSWANKRGFIKGGCVTTQRIKFFEELGELCGGILKNKIEVIKDSIGDCIVVAINFMAINDCKFEDYLTEKVFYAVKHVLEQDVNIKKYTSLLIGSSDLMVSDDCEMYNSYVIDVCMFLACIAYHYNLTLIECLDFSYNEIKNRKGKTIDGNFVKADDLKNFNLN